MSVLNVEVKKEPTELDHETRILTLLKENAKGIKVEELCCYFHEKAADILEVLNRLIAQRRINILKTKNEETLVKLAAPSLLNQVQDVDDNEKLVLQLIEEVGNKGIWRHEIQRKSKIVEVQLTKILNRLTTKKLIKPITSVSAGKKKMYILASLEPDPCVTGGSFYNGQQFDSVYFNTLHEMCRKYLQDKAESMKKLPLNPVEQRMGMFLSTSDIHSWIQNSKISKVELKMQEIDDILQTLVFDGKAEHTVRTNALGEQINYYCAVSPLIVTTGLMKTPCGQCPFMNECKEGAVISPSTCKYMSDWLNF